MYTRPHWADSVASVFSGMANNKRPVNVPQGVSLFSGASVTGADLAAFFAAAENNDQSLNKARLTMATFDSLGTDVLGLESGEPKSLERRSWLYENLALKEATEILDKRAPVMVERATVIARTFEPWYEKSAHLRPSTYWDDYSEALRKKGWPASSIESVDVSSTEVVRRLSDPIRVEAKQTKGLVVGYVQSGKTANFTGVIAKAIDAGYRMIIVLTGTIEILRSQTQRRIDMELIGVENILAGQNPDDPMVLKELDYQQDRAWLSGDFITHGDKLILPNVPEIQRVTTHKRDYTRLPQGLTRLRFSRNDKTKPLNHPDNIFATDAYIAVVKKNKAPLQKLIKDLEPIRKDLDDLPILIIDDESDLASVDTTNPKRWRDSAQSRERTTINGLISKLMSLGKRAQYVGYTATPFANVFIDPDDNSDLFPSDFLISLPRPPGYMGVQEFHDVGKSWTDDEKSVSTSNEMAFVRGISGNLDDDRIRWEDELQDAMDAFVLSGAIKKYRQAKSVRTFRHHTMLIHESVFQTDHATAAQTVSELWTRGGYVTMSCRDRLEKLFQDDYLPVMTARCGDEAVPAAFEELEPFLAEAVAAIGVDGSPVIVVNSNKEVAQRALDFETQAMWCILIGGAQLSRGFTVEGLTISFYRRRTLMGDTLMQAGRWFGFRPGYQDLVRLYIRRDHEVDLYEAYEALLRDEEAFREELRQYEGLDEEGRPLLEPRAIPPLVSQHLPWLRPTARVKMWNARITSKGTGGRILDLYSLPPRGDARLQTDLNAVGIPLLAIAHSDPQVIDFSLDGRGGSFQARTGLISADDFLRLFSKIGWHPEVGNSLDPLKAFITRATEDGRIKDWAIVWPQPAKAFRTLTLSPLPGAARVIRRGRRAAPRIDFVGSDSKHRAGVERIAAAEAVAGLAASTTRGVVLAYLVDDRSDAATATTDPAREDLVVLLSVAVPAAATPNRRNLIQWTVIRSDRPEAAIKLV